MNTNIQQSRELGWGAIQRLQFIEFRLLWEGHVNRKDLIDTFAISVPQSTIDFREYMERAPGNMDYDKRLKHYVPLESFKPVFISDRPEGYLSQLLASAYGGQNQSAPGLIGATPSFDVLATPERRVDSRTLQLLLKCIRDGLSVEIHYQSLTSPIAAWRRISPHSLASDGLRWHVRAYCSDKQDYRDFVLGRIMDIRDIDDSSALAGNDVEWNTIIKVTIGPNPDLTEDQHKIIGRDYSMVDGKSEILLRRSMLFYLKQRLGLGSNKEMLPAAQQVVILSIDDEVSAG